MLGPVPESDGRYSRDLGRPSGKSQAVESAALSTPKDGVGEEESRRVRIPSDEAARARVAGPVLYLEDDKLEPPPSGEGEGRAEETTDPLVLR